MDCGPAALKCLLEGYGISASYGRLREMCQTNVDGTSIDSLATIATDLGLDVEQVLIPADHLEHSWDALLPGVLVVQGLSAMHHFVVAWRERSGVVQVMDPSLGRRIRRSSELIRECSTHTFEVPEQDWRQWARGPQGIRLVLHRLKDLGHADPASVVEEALKDPTWVALGALDASLRMVQSWRQAGALKKGPQAVGTWETLWRLAKAEATQDAPEAVPDFYWSVRPAPPEDQVPRVTFRGAVLLRVAGRKQTAALNQEGSSLQHELAAVLAEPRPQPGRALWNWMLEDGWGAVVTVGISAVLTATGFLAQVVMVRALASLGDALSSSMKVQWALMLGVLVVATMALELPAFAWVQRLGRSLENRLRMKLFLKIPKIGERYFSSRTASDMAGRAHALYRIRDFPVLAERLLRVVFAGVLTLGGIALVAPDQLWPALAVALVSGALPFFTQPLLIGRELKVREHLAVLERLQLDALLGAVPLRTHDAGRIFRQVHENALTLWARANRDLISGTALVEAVLSGVGTGAAAFVVWRTLNSGLETWSALLCVYWLLSLPAVGQEIAFLLRVYPSLRNITLRAQEMLSAQEEASASSAGAGKGPWEPGADRSAARIHFKDVTVRASGHAILNNVNVEIPAGAHVAIVGQSGAGKSSLVGLLLGLHSPADGVVEVDGLPLAGETLFQLRRQTAWVDPAVRLWNRSFAQNLAFGTPARLSPPIETLVSQADLVQVLERLPNGANEVLGDQGMRLSGGEGQRVRFGRALGRPWARLVILDEAFRGLDHAMRRDFLQRARALWRDSTLLFVTHDLQETLEFDQVLVVEDGALVEQGAPEELKMRADSRFAELLKSDAHVREELWRNYGWRRLRMKDGTLTTPPGAS